MTMDQGMSDATRDRRAAALAARASVTLEGFTATAEYEAAEARYVAGAAPFADLLRQAGTARDAHGLEANFARARILELHEAPVCGTFDAAHLCEVNRRIFQDLPGAGLTAVRPGAFRRAMTDPRRDWIKLRAMDGLPPSTVAYSRMDGSAMARLEGALGRADPGRLAGLNAVDFIREIAGIYSELDYVHPFDDGNSRTLRAFTGQLARAAGRGLDWARFAQGAAGRNVLYIARDLSVNAIALPLVVGDDTRRELAFMLDQFGGNRDLAALLADAVQS